MQTRSMINWEMVQNEPLRGQKKGINLKKKKIEYKLQPQLQPWDELQ